MGFDAVDLQAISAVNLQRIHVVRIPSIGAFFEFNNLTGSDNNGISRTVFQENHVPVRRARWVITVVTFCVSTPITFSFASIKGWPSMTNYGVSLL